MLSRFSAPLGGRDRGGLKTILQDLLADVKSNLYTVSRGRPCQAIPNSQAITPR